MAHALACRCAQLKALAHPALQHEIKHAASSLKQAGLQGGSQRCCTASLRMPQEVLRWSTQVGSCREQQVESLIFLMDRCGQRLTCRYAPRLAGATSSTTAPPGNGVCSGGCMAPVCGALVRHAPQQWGACACHRASWA